MHLYHYCVMYSYTDLMVAPQFVDGVIETSRAIATKEDMDQVRNELVEELGEPAEFVITSFTKFS